MLDHRRCLFDHFQVGLLQDNFLAGALATRLFAGLLWPADNSTLAECVKAVHQNLAETAAVGNQQRDGSYAPHNA